MTKHLGRLGLYLDTGKLAFYDNYNDAVTFDSMSEFVASLQALLDAGNAHYSTNYQIVEASAPDDYRVALYPQRSFLDEMKNRKMALMSIGLDERLSNTVNRHFRDKVFDIEEWAQSVVSNGENLWAYKGLGEKGIKIITDVCQQWAEVRNHES